MAPDLVAQLQFLETNLPPAAVRFDRGPAFLGRVVVLPAAYNPPTIAHLHLLELATREPGITAASAFLSTRNVDKGVHGATLVQRVEMLLALAETNAFAVLATNQARLADQSRALTETFDGVEFDFIVGYDTLERVFDERYYEDIAAELAPFFAAHRLLATNRAEHGIAEVERFVEEHPLARHYQDRILIRELDEHPASLSSTAAREDASAGLESAQLPPAVAAYIREHGLYGP